MADRLLIGAVIGVIVLASPAYAQVVREDGQDSIAGVIGESSPAASWTFKSPGSEILFASLDAEIYRKREHHEGDVLAAADGGGCADEGTARFCLQVIDATQTVVCEASRPAPPPGWQVDPRLACVLPVTGTQSTYTVRVSATGPDGACSPPSLVNPVADTRPFLLNISLRRIAPSGTSIHQATAQSRNRF